jgi:putative ubiquitin-RnfH superfamily antitoxin RatB of RatAB toxin-antitoxin module
MKIEVLISMGPRQVISGFVDCEEGVKAADVKAIALQQLGLKTEEFSLWRSAVWGKAVQIDTPLVQGDRLELLRPLLVDPKEARRLRFNQQGSRAAGLFAKKRQGAKAGY